MSNAPNATPAALRAARAEILRQIDASGGLLAPRALVEAAQAEDHPLHSFFTWEGEGASAQARDRELLLLLDRFAGEEEPEPERAPTLLRTISRQ